MLSSPHVTLSEVAFGSKPSHLFGLTLLLIPSAAFLWRNSDLPQFGDIHDDSVYYVSAKSLALAPTIPILDSVNVPVPVFVSVAI